MCLASQRTTTGAEWTGEAKTACTSCQHIQAHLARDTKNGPGYASTPRREPHIAPLSRITNTITPAGSRHRDVSTDMSDATYLSDLMEGRELRARAAAAATTLVAAVEAAMAAMAEAAGASKPRCEIEEGRLEERGLT